jgi:putative endonuclease
MDPRHALGARGEHFAAEHFRRLGFDVIAQGFRTRFGEIDLIASDGTTLVFAEVKTRRAGSGHPWDALHDAKRQQVRRMAASWFTSAPERPYHDVIRFDAVGVVLDRAGGLVSLDHLEGAF